MIKSFTDLEAWRSAHNLALLIYGVTDLFPATERFGLSAQLRRAAVSVSSNLAEGFGRKTAKDRYHFYTMASGSLYEIKSQMLLAKDLTFASNEQFLQINESLNRTHKLVHGLLRSHVA